MGCNACLIYERFRKETQRIQLQDIGEPKYHLLNSCRLQFVQALADSIRVADERTCGNRASQKSGGNFCPRLLIGLANSTDARHCAVNALVIVSDAFTMLLEDSKFSLDGLQIAADITGVTILRY